MKIEQGEKWMKSKKVMALSLSLLLSVGFLTGKTEAATKPNGGQWVSSVINYKNIGTNASYKGYWNTAAGRWTDTTHVIMSVGTKNNFEAGNYNAGKVYWDGQTEYIINSHGDFTYMRAWLNSYYTDGPPYSKSIVEGVATHEFGHALGLSHNDSAPSVMASHTFNTDGSLARTNNFPKKDDTDTLKKIYGTITFAGMEKQTDLIPLGSSENHVILSPSYHVGYKSIEELASYADLIVEGEITDKSKLKKDAPEIFISYRTERSIKVKDVLKGNKLMAGQEITFEQMGGADTFATVVSEDSTPLKKGEKVILFFEKSDDGSYSLMNDNTSIFVDELGNDNYKYLKDQTKFNKTSLQMKIK